MASKIDFSTLTLNEEEARSANEAIFEEVYSKPELNQVHNVMTGVDQDRYIPIFGQFGLVGKVDPGSCSTNAETTQIPTSEKQWAPKLISGRLAHCQDDIDDLLKFWKKSMRALYIWEDVDNEMFTFIKDRGLDVVMQSIFRISEFGDTNADVIASGGYLTAGTTKTYFNMLDGMWAQIFTDQAGSALSYRHTITENAGASKSAQLNLAADAALKMFRGMYNNCDSRILDGNPVYQVTRTLLSNWQDYMEDKSLSFSLQRTEEGKGSTPWSYRGIPIVPRYDWDRTIQTYMSGTTYYLPHRCVLTDVNNIPIGTSDEGSLKEFDSFYVKKDKVWYLDFAYRLDQKNLQEKLMAVAY